LSERFWEKVEKRGPDECWEWKAYREKTGYGQLQVGTYETPDATRSHRIAWELTNGPIPDGLHVCHHCDNPPCCNPTHLFLGTHQDNMDDMLAKGRDSKPPRVHVTGEQNGRSVYTNDQVGNFRREFHKAGVSIRAFAILKDVSYPTMWRIINHATYQDA